MDYAAKTRNRKLTELYAADAHRLEQFSLQAGPIYMDFSKQPIDREGLRLFEDLALPLSADGLLRVAQQYLAGPRGFDPPGEIHRRHTCRHPSAPVHFVPSLRVKLRVYRHNDALRSELGCRLFDELLNALGEGLVRVMHQDVALAEDGKDVGGRSVRSRQPRRRCHR